MKYIFKENVCDPQGYVREAKKRPEMFPIEKVTVIFSNIEEIHLFASDLLASLEQQVNPDEPHLSQLGQCFLDHVSTYCQSCLNSWVYFSENIFLFC